MTQFRPRGRQFVCLCGLAIASAPAAAQVQFYRLPRPAGGTFTAATGVSPDGRWIAGKAGFSGAQTQEQAILWDPARVPTALGDVPTGLIFSDALSVTHDGVEPIVACSGTEEYGTRPFRWRPSTGLVQIASPDPIVYYMLLRDATPGGAYLIGTGTPQGVLLPRSVIRVHAATGVVEELGQPAGAVGDAEGFATNTSGTAIVGHADAPAPQDWIAFLWTEGGGFQSLGLLAGFPDYSTSAYAVSDDASVVAGDANFFVAHVPFRWTRWGGMTQIGPSGESQGMTPDGNLIVGTTSTMGFMWDRRHGFVDFRARLTRANAGVDPTSGLGLTIMRPRTISPDGRVIVGDARFGSQTDGFVAIMPPPCWADLTTTAAAGVSGYGEPNGVVNSEDFFYFLARYVEGDLLRADITTGAIAGQAGFGVPNGAINSDDFFYFLGLYVVGCT